MNTVRILRLANGELQLQLTGGGLIPTYEYFDHPKGMAELIQNATEWCGRTPGEPKDYPEVASTHIQAVPKEAGDGLLTPEQRADFIKAANGPRAQDVIDQWDDKHGPTEEELNEFCRLFPQHHVAANHLKWLAEQPEAYKGATAASNGYRVGQPHPSPASKPEQ